MTYQAFLSAVKKNELETVAQFLKNPEPHFDIDYKDKNGLTGLVHAASRGHEQLVAYLLEKGANPEITDMEYHTTLWHLIEQDYGMYLDYKEEKITFNEAAQVKGRLEKVKNLIVTSIAQRKEYIFPKEQYTTTQLLDVLTNRLLSTSDASFEKNGLKELIQCLDYDYFVTRFIEAIKNNNLTLLKEALGSENTLIDKRLNEYGMMALHMAALYGNYEVIIELHKHGANLKALDDGENNVLHYALRDAQTSKKKEVFKSLVQLDKSLLEKRNKEGITPESNWGFYEQNYKRNTSLLLTSLMFHEVKNKQKPIHKTEEALFQKRVNKTQFTLNMIAEQVLKKTKIRERNIEFVAIGVREEGNHHIITTNYHAPFVYRLQDLIDDEFNFKEVQEYKNKFKKDKNIKLAQGTNETKIHAETMIASLKEKLGITQVLVVSASKGKMANCIFCANYLSGKGFPVDAHQEKIKNYHVPTEEIIENAYQWFNYLDVNYPLGSHYDFIGTNMGINETTNSIFGATNPNLYNHVFLNHVPTAQNNSERNQDICKYVIDYYPESKVEGEVKIYADALKMNSPEAAMINKRSGISFHNLKITLFNDGRLRKSQSGSEGEISPVSPQSPRTSLLAEKINFWSKQGANSQVIVDRDSIAICR